MVHAAALEDHSRRDGRSRRGSSLIIMQGPDGTQMPNRGVPEVVPNERLVFTDAFTSAWVPSAKPFFTGILTFEDEAGQTRHTARARHWSAEDNAAHEAMGLPGLGHRH
ncbi:SRPBCC domain-containing protein [Candidatus Skiveiella danica]|uniref:SRPBCC domain-containing protein n=1 Tax=Candidatus Skiveiella danica TaxID=3386177 RepID=UPI0039B96294